MIANRGVGSGRRRRLTGLLLALVAFASLGMKGEPFRYAREVQAQPGWTVLDLPDDVLALAQPGLADVRLKAKAGELGYVLEEELLPVAPRVPLHDVESVPGRETTALLDRGPSPALCTELELEVLGTAPFLKPLVVEASADGKEFRELARTSIFRLPGGLGMARVPFAANDRRFFRIRSDDRNSDPVQPVAARCNEASVPAAPLREVALALERITPTDGNADTFVLRLPSAKLPIVELKLAIGDLAFAREARVYERILFRDELSRRLVGSGKLSRSATGTESTTLALGELSGGALELEIDRLGASLDVTGVLGRVRPKRLVFVAPAEPGLTLLYGSTTAAPTKYDLAEALGRGRPSALAPATLGPVRDSGRTDAPPAPGRATLDASGWAERVPIVLPKKGSVAYLDLDGAKARNVHAVRILDASGRQVPFLVEAGERLVAHGLTFTTEREGTSTRVKVAGLSAADSVQDLELHASAPQYFERSLSVFVEVKDRRGVIGRRQLGSASWEKRPETADASVRIPLALNGESALNVEIADGDNPPLTLSGAVAHSQRRRVDFLFEPGDQLQLLSENPNAGPPRYDFDLIASAVLESPALPASLGTPPPAKSVEPARVTPKWFWWVAVAAGLLVVLALVRVRPAG